MNFAKLKWVMKQHPSAKNTHSIFSSFKLTSAVLRIRDVLSRIPDPDPTIAPSRIRIPDPGSGG
jgi:hypothetical protein